MTIYPSHDLDWQQLIEDFKTGAPTAPKTEIALLEATSPFNAAESNLEGTEGGECPECGFEGDLLDAEPCPECGAVDSARL